MNVDFQFHQVTQHPDKMLDKNVQRAQCIDRNQVNCHSRLFIKVSQMVCP